METQCSIGCFIPVFIFIILLSTCCYFAREREKKYWNNGICAKSGLPWKQFDTASDGSRGYSDGGINHTWISWGVDKLK